MNMGCLSFLILFPVGIFIWARGEMRRRNAMPPEELAKLEAEEDYGPIDENLECIFCKTKGYVRRNKEDYYVGGGPARNSPKGLAYLATIGIDRYSAASRAKCEPRTFAHCMNCGNNWEFYPPEEKTS